MNVRLPCRCAVPSLLVLAFAGYAGAADTEVTIGNERGSTTYEVALDELHAVCIAPAALPEQVRSMTADGKTQLSGVTSLPQLESVASTLCRAAGRPTVAAVLYPAGSRDQSCRAILSRKLTLHVKPGTNLADVAARHRCRVVENLAADLALVEPQDPSLLAGSRAAADLAADPQVRAAEVQVHHLVAPRYTPIDRDYHAPTGIDPLNSPNPYNPYWMQYTPAGTAKNLIERRQWHLHRAPRGMNLEPVWGSAQDVKDGYTGTGIRVAVVDTGVDTSHPDLGVVGSAAGGNLDLDMAYNFVGSPTDDVRPQSAVENHGTAIAGLIAEREGKTGRDSQNRPIAIGGVGVAFDANVVPLRFITSRDIGSLPNPIGPVPNPQAGGPADPNKADLYPGKTEDDFFRVVQYQLNPRTGKQIHISCNSWGNTGIGSFMTLGDTALTAFNVGVTAGRSGRGLIFVWAAGNDHGLAMPYATTYTSSDLLPEDNACYDAWLNRYTIPVGALNRGGRKSSYSEIGPCLLVCAPGGDYNFTPYQRTTPTDDTQVEWGFVDTPDRPVFWMHGLTTTDRSRIWNGNTFVSDDGYNRGERPKNGDLSKLNRNSTVAPTPSEDLPQWMSTTYVGGTVLNNTFVDGLGNPINYGYNGKQDSTESANGPDSSGDGYRNTGEDLDHDGRLDVNFWFDADGDNRRDLGEDTNNNGILDPGEDINGDGILERNEDLNGDGIFEPALGEDLDGDGHFDYSGVVVYTPAAPDPIIRTTFISEGLWNDTKLGNVMGEPDLNQNQVQDTPNVDIYYTGSLTPYRTGVPVNENLNNDSSPTIDPTPTGGAYALEGVDGYFDLYEDFNHDGSLTTNEDLNGDGYWSQVGEDLADNNNNNGCTLDHQWTPGDYTYWAPLGYTHPQGEGFDVAGTSFAAANASGVIALMLQARPELTWRDVQLILAHRARLPQPSGKEIQRFPAGDIRYQDITPAFITATGYDLVNGLTYDHWSTSDTERALQATPPTTPTVGFYYNHWYGFGAINALTDIYGVDSSRSIIGVAPATAAFGAMTYPGWPVPLADQIANPGARYWPLLPAEETPITATVSPALTIPTTSAHGSTAGTPRLDVDLDITVPNSATDFRIETVELHLDINISNRSRLTLALVSPSGTTAMIPQRISKNGTVIDNQSNLNYTFTLRNFLGEHPQGTWRVVVLDTLGPASNPGLFNSASITVHGHRPYPVPTGASTSPSGIPAGTLASFQVRGSNFRRNAANEVTMTKALWFDRFNDTSADINDPADDRSATIANGMVADLETTYVDDSTLNVKVPASLTQVSPGDAVILIANPALPIGQDLTSISFGIYGFQRHNVLGPHPTAAEDEDYYLLDAWEPSMERYTISDSFIKGVHTSYPAGIDPITLVGFPAGFDCRVKSNGLSTSLHLHYSRPPTITPIVDQVMPAGTPVGTAFTVSFTVDDPDINPATVNAARASTDETLTLNTQVFNQSAVQPPLVLTQILPGPQGTGTYSLSGLTASTSGLSIVSVSVSDGVTSVTTSFRVVVLTDEKASGCGGGMGLALIGGPLAIWLLRRRRRV